MGDEYSSCINVDYLLNTEHWSAMNAYGVVELAARSKWSCEPDNLKGMSITVE